MPGWRITGISKKPRVGAAASQAGAWAADQNGMERWESGQTSEAHSTYPTASAQISAKIRLHRTWDPYTSMLPVLLAA